ncbi:MAG: hypothetical protein KGJ25_08555 [Betaproteobacteria bacterium]|nr:hypothetical protein [Betaproteobacteria bacterium]
MKSRTLALASIVALAVASGTALAQERNGGAWHGGGGAPRGGGGWHGGGEGWHGGGGEWHGGEWHGGEWHGGGWHGGDEWHGGVWYGPAIGFSFGIPGYWGWPYVSDYPYDYPYAYPAPYPVYVPSEPSTYIEEPAPHASGPTYWYYCTDPQGYYPYVQNCTRPWVQVLPQSVPGAQNSPTPSR